MSRRLAVVLAVALIGAAGVVLSAALLRRDAEPPALRSGELSAEAFVKSVGVVTHFHYVDTAYGRQGEVLARLRELGVGHIREAAPSPSGALADALRAARAAGIRATVGNGDLNVDPARVVGDSLAVMGDGIAAFEAPNELDNGSVPDWPQKLTSYMPALQAAVREQAPGTSVIGPSFIDSVSRTRIPGDLPGLFNGHPYSGGEPPEPSLARALSESRATLPGRGVVFTETGYHNALAASVGQPPASEEAAAVYLPRLLATAFGAGVRRTFIYELLDEKPDPALADPEQHFGLLRNDLSPKPAFMAVKTLIAALRSTPGVPTGGPLAWELQVHGDERVERLTLVRRDGSRVILLWRAVSVWDRDGRRALDPGRLAVELSFAGFGARDIAVWRPSVSTQPVLRRQAAQQLALELEGDLVAVSLR